VRDELVSAAGRVSAGAYPQFVRVDIDARGPAGGRRTLAFQQVEGAADRLAAGGQAGLAGDGGREREGVPGEGRQVTRCFLGDGDERRAPGDDACFPALTDLVCLTVYEREAERSRAARAWTGSYRVLCFLAGGCVTGSGPAARFSSVAGPGAAVASRGWMPLYAGRVPPRSP
jgi:hypothetical protein